MGGYKALLNAEISSLSKFARDFFHLLESFGKNENITNFVNIWLLEDPILKIKTSTCGPFELSFYKKKFFPNENRRLYQHKNLTNTAIETLLNELLLLDRVKNEHIINE